MSDTYQLQLDMYAKHDATVKRFERVARHGQLDAFIPKTNGTVVLVGGPRNRGAVLPKQTREGIESALRATMRAQRRFQEAAR